MSHPADTKSKYRKKLTPADVREIVARCDNGETYAAVARDFPVTRAMVGCIMAGRAWSHVTGIEPHKPGYARGEDSGAAKLTRAQVLEIVRRCKAGESYRSVACDFPVGGSQVGSIMRGECWALVTGIEGPTRRPKRVHVTNPKLTEREVLEIVERYQAGETQRSIARDFQIHQTQVSNIVTGQHWAHVTGI